jgi:sugar/nucleoside kinase (ribokinase family)
MERRLGPQRWECACIRRGAAGCVIVMDGKRDECAGYAVKSENTVGAGDAFSAGVPAWVGTRLAT